MTAQALTALAAIAGAAGAAAAASAPAAQVDMLAWRLTAPNPQGWHNTFVPLDYLCRPGVPCPERSVLLDDGVHRLRVPLADAGGDDPYLLRIDRTPPVVHLALADQLRTGAAVIDVVAEVADALSGLSRAACNGTQAPIDADGRVRCRLSLLPGVNDVVVEVSDRAGNSTSAGARVVRTGPATALRLLPEAVAVGIGATRPLQVLDDFHRPAADVEWFVDRPDVAQVDAQGMVRGLAPGLATITASAGALRATTAVTVFAGSEAPVGTVHWKALGFSIVQARPLPPYTGPPHGPMGTADSRPGGRHTVRFQTERTGLVEWTQVPAVSDDEAGRQMHRHGHDGALLVMDGPDGRSALVRSGPSPGVRPWRYQSSGRLRPELVVDRDGRVLAVETPASGFPVVVFFERDGRVLKREPMMTGVAVERHQACGGGASIDLQPAEIGPPALHPDGTLSVEFATGRDVIDGCSGAAIERRRMLQLLRVAPADLTVLTLRDIDVAPNAPVPTFDLLPAVLVGDGALLAPWRLASDTLAAHVSRVGRDGVVEEFALPAAGVLVPCLDDLVATTDGTTLVIFHGASGEVRWSARPPGGDLAILAVRDRVLVTREGNAAVARRTSPATGAPYHGPVP
jgi:hypothetical protein